MSSPARRPVPPLDRALFALAAAPLVVSIVYPTARLAVEAFGRWDWSSVTQGSGFEALINTVVIGFLSVLTAGVLGTSLAFLVTRYRFPGRRPLAAMAYLPFTLPPLVGTLSFYYIIGDDGFVPRLVHQVMGNDDFHIGGPTAILLIHTYSFMVFFYAMVSAALESMDMAQIEASRTLGAGPIRTFWKVTVPLLMPALLGAALLTFMTSGASFSAPYFFGDDFPMLSVEIYEHQSNARFGSAQTLTVVLACVSLLGILLFRTRRSAATGGSKGAPREIKSQGGRTLAGVAAWVSIGLLLTPHFTIIWLSFADHREWHTEIFPTALTLANYADILSDPTALRPIWNSVWMSLAGALATVLAGLPAAYLIGRHRWGGTAVNFMVMIPWALPGTVVAMNLIGAFNDPWLPIYNTVLLLPIAYFVRSVPLLTRMVTASVQQFDAGLLEAGRTLGGSRAYCFRTIIIPLIAPSLVASTALVFATSLGEFVATILLYTPANLPIAIQINMNWRGSGVGSAFAYAVFLMTLVTVTFLISRRFASRVL